MEALIGFAIGYWTGTHDGREGLQKALAALDAITKTDQFQKLTGTAVAMGGTIVSKSMDSNAGGMAGALTGMMGGAASRVAPKVVVSLLRKVAA